MKIAIDIDEVLANTIEQVVLFYNDNYSPKVGESDLRGRYFSFMGKEWEESNKKYFAFCESEYPDRVQPMKGVVEAIDKLSKNHELVAITGRPAFTRAQTIGWMNKYFPGKFEDIIFNNDRLDSKDFAEYWGRPKAEICDEVGAEILIDDLPEFMIGSDHLRVYIFDQPWNQEKAPDHAIRVYSWPELVDKIEKQL